MSKLRTRSKLPAHQNLFVMRDGPDYSFTSYGTITISGRQGFRIGLTLLRESLLATFRRTSVSFSFWDDVS